VNDGGNLMAVNYVLHQRHIGHTALIVAAGTNMQRSGRSGNADEFWTSSPEVAIDFGLKAGAFQTSI
jgi:hypothetical protein